MARAPRRCAGRRGRNGKRTGRFRASSPAEFSAFLRKDFPVWQKLFNEIGIKPE